ncbi:MAG: hypothetical protein KBA61_02560 [Spirochaetes bacterium]|nr:hypothetical protein [Spirochaetota bacterium]
MAKFLSMALAAALAGAWIHTGMAEPLPSRGRIGVVRSQFDQVERILDRYRVPHTLLNYADLEKAETFGNYDTIFFPCGMSKPIEANIDVTARGFYVHKVLLKKDSPKIDKQKLYDNISEFIRKGGSGYFSDFSYDVVQGAFSCFDFHHDFPNLGMPGTYRVDLDGELSRFTGKKSIDMLMPHSGWVLLKSVSGAEVLAEGTVETPRGGMKGPLVMLMKRGDGELIYSSYHSDNPLDETMRFSIFRLSMKWLLKRYDAEIRKWNQTVTGEVFDSLLPGEWARSYRLTLGRGRNTLYFYAEKGVFQVDLFDRDMNLVISRDAGGSDFTVGVRAPHDGEYTLAVYGSGNSYYNPYSVVSASGWRLIPYVTAARVMLILAAVFAVAVAVTAFQMSHPKKIGGRIRR